MTRETATDAALAGLDFYVEHQNTDTLSADRGRFPSDYNVKSESVELWSSSWRTGVLVAAMLSGYRFSKEEKYLNAARFGIDYIKSLQNFSPEFPRLYAAIREDTPQFPCFHPRDAMTAALALLDWHEQTGDTTAKDRSEQFAKWFMQIAMEKGWPYWTAHFDDKPWKPTWCGSFHSGSAYAFYRLFESTGKAEYKDAMENILKLYNSNHLDENGKIAVILDRDTGEILDGKIEEHDTDKLRKWEIMHQYNDDFGMLANLGAFKLTGNNEYRNAIERFIRRMVRSQREDGGFGPKDYSVPSASGMILIEVYAAKSTGLDLMCDEAIGRAVEHILYMQRPSDTKATNGVFKDDDEHVDCRTTAYSIMALLRYGGASDPFYSI